VGSVQFCPHASAASIVANTVSDTIQVWDIANAATPLISSFKGHNRAVTGLAWSSTDPNIMASCSTDSFLNLWDIRDENKVLTNIRIYVDHY
jgi:WD40 repeat protein